MKKEPIGLQLKLNMPFGEALQRFSSVNTKDFQEQQEVDPVPFVKWAGGKRGIISEIILRLPKKFNNYYEPFVGGGALFFAIAGRIKKAYLSDMNIDLIIAYQMVKKTPEKLIKELEEHAKRHSEEYYYRVRERHNQEDPIKIAGRLIYLNRTCYNGLYRTNKKGEFNVPFGSYANPDIVRNKTIMECNKALQKTEIEYRDFSTITPSKGDFVYFDPPYHPTNGTSFTTYTKGDFTEQDQNRLKEFIITLHKNGVFIMLSNSDTPFIRDLYKGNVFKTQLINAPRSVNCKADKRNPAKEVLITNY